MREPRLIVFDLDGTLVDSLADIADATNALLRELGLPERPVEAYRRIAGDGARVAVQRATGMDFSDDPAHLDALTRRYLEIYARRGSPRSAPYPGIVELLDHLGAGAPGRPALAVLTNKPHDIATALVAKTLPATRFVAVEGVREGTVRKPDPGGLVRIMGLVGASASETVYVGDTDTDMRTARNGGVRAVGALWGFRDEAELRAAGADETIARPADLLAPLAGRAGG